MLRLLASMKVTRTWELSTEATTHLGNVTRVSGSSQDLLDNGVLDFVLLRRTLEKQLDCKETMHTRRKEASTYHCDSLTE